MRDEGETGGAEQSSALRHLPSGVSRTAIAALASRHLVCWGHGMSGLSSGTSAWRSTRQADSRRRDRRHLGRL